ncbi:hypothetical protein F5050DRAFT_169742 [Lentinula boryana]|uniref:Uncharacterized protein n=1 Tax=Lentinula boryana TaxID=40481 RepID=A0ABQ8QCA0_9AGAR|nr:hypothetical protein F5050DRAFT_169742 [Lentinula boryana]
MSRNSLPPSAEDLHVPVVQQQAQAQPLPPVVRSQPSILERDRPPHQRASKFGPPINNDSNPSSALRRDQSPPARYQQRDQPVSDNTDAPSSFTSRSNSSGNVDNAVRSGSGVYGNRGHIEDHPASQLPKAPRAMGRDEAAPSAPRSSTVRERSPRGADRDTRELGPSHHPGTWKDEFTNGQARGRGSRGRTAPHLSGTNNVPMGSRIGADGIPNGPARTSSNAPRVPLSSANMIPVTNNRYTESSKVTEEVKSPTHIRNGGIITMRSTPVTAVSFILCIANLSLLLTVQPYERDALASRGHANVDVAMPLRPLSTSPHAPYQEASLPPPSREVTTSPSWEQDSGRGGRSASGRSIDTAEPLPKYPRNGSDSYGRRTVNGYRPPSPIGSSSMLTHNLPAKPVQQTLPNFNRSRGSRVSPQRHWRPPSPEARLVLNLVDNDVILHPSAGHHLGNRFLPLDLVASGAFPLPYHVNGQLLQKLGGHVDAQLMFNFLHQKETRIVTHLTIHQNLQIIIAELPTKWTLTIFPFANTMTMVNVIRKETFPSVLPSVEGVVHYLTGFRFQLTNMFLLCVTEYKSRRKEIGTSS